MIDFLINLALNLALKIHQKSTQEAPKINDTCAWTPNNVFLQSDGLNNIGGQAKGAKRNFGKSRQV